MVNNMRLKPEAFVYKKRRRLERNILLKSKRKKILGLIISLGLITITSFFLTHNLYVRNNSKDLGFSVEYNLTTGFSSENKLLRVQEMSLIYFDGDTAIIEASGLAKSPPHEKTSIKASFKKDANKCWIFKTFLNSN
ncbi:hypothetical protein [Clostridium sp. C2-6-12]|uniref:hypothetical protein n=1 Tax=Clostridium sp. C2-6-12 TaxID=2698832 RepID=UPI00136B5D0A|nr:hypothetical protein [Clostridium sp. C2-6-12]